MTSQMYNSSVIGTPSRIPFNMANARRQLHFNSPATTKTSHQESNNLLSTPTTTPRLNRRAEHGINREPLLVFLRIRPSKNPNLTEDEKLIKVENPTTIRTAAPKEGKYQFSKVFTEDSTQEEVFSATTKPVVTNFLRGYSGIVFAHGMTGSGKTFTIHGKSDGDKSAEGVIPRTLETIFTSIKHVEESEQPSKIRSGPAAPLPAGAVLLEHGYSYKIFVSFFEIYNETIYDLLASPEERQPLQLKDRGDAVAPLIDKLLEERVHSVEEAKALFEKGKKNRKVAQTQLNQDSSRSHSIITIKLAKFPTGVDIEQNPSLLKLSKLAIVDLAGSERANRTGSVGVRLKEAAGINLSLMTFGRVIETLRANQRIAANNAASGTATPKIVPYRESKLTRLVQHYLTGGRAVMIVNISPDPSDFDETINVLKFSAVAKEIVVPEERPPSMYAPTPSSSTLGGLSRRVSKRKIEEVADKPKPEKKIPRLAEDSASSEFVPLDKLDPEAQLAFEIRIREEIADSISETLLKNELRQKEETEQQIALVKGTYESRICLLKGLWNQNKEISSSSSSSYAIDETTQIVNREIEELQKKLLLAEQREQTARRLLREQSADLQESAKDLNEGRKREIQLSEKLKREREERDAIENERDNLQVVIEELQHSIALRDEKYAALAEEYARLSRSISKSKLPTVTNPVVPQECSPTMPLTPTMERNTRDASEDKSQNAVLELMDVPADPSWADIALEKPKETSKNTKSSAPTKPLSEVEKSNNRLVQVVKEFAIALSPKKPIKKSGSRVAKPYENEPENEPEQALSDSESKPTKSLPITRHKKASSRAAYKVTSKTVVVGDDQESVVIDENDDDEVVFESPKKKTTKKPLVERFKTRATSITKPTSSSRAKTVTKASASSSSTTKPRKTLRV